MPDVTQGNGTATLSPVTETTVSPMEGITITLRRATVRSNAHMRSLQQRFGAHFADMGKDLSEYFAMFIICAPAVVKVEGSKWRPPGMFDDVKAVEKSFQDWMEILPNVAAMTDWINAIGAVNGAANADELTPDFEGEGLDEADPK